MTHEYRVRQLYNREKSSGTAYSYMDYLTLAAFGKVSRARVWKGGASAEAVITGRYRSSINAGWMSA
jgi:hypothetical protein